MSKDRHRNGDMKALGQYMIILAKDDKAQVPT